MNHMHMGHGDMGDMPGHGGHEGHTMPDMPSHGEMCNMNMLFTWDTTNLCIVFSQWHIRTTAGLLFSLVAIVLVGMGYEALRAGTRRYEMVMNKRMESIPSEFVFLSSFPPYPPPGLQRREESKEREEDSVCVVTEDGFLPLFQSLSS